MTQIPADSNAQAPFLRHVGIDEAGYGPTLGPLVIAGVAILGDPKHLAALGAMDSKKLHKSGDLAPLERVALPALGWLAGFQPDTAADVFALFGESAADRADLPWLAGADQLRVPVAAESLPTWSALDLLPAGLSGVIVQPRAYNAALRAGRNKADLEARHIAAVLGRLAPDGLAADVVVDRLGGRKFYAGLLTEAFSLLPEVLIESAEISRYRCGQRTVAFQVGGDAASPCTALASCLAKYVRELHLRLFNAYWCGRHPWLKPTAGYPEDAARWLHQIGSGVVGAYGPDLVRGWTGGTTPDPHGP